MEDIVEGIDPEAARLAFEALQPQLDAQTQLRAATTDVNRAIIHAASIGRMVQKPEMKAEFASLPARRFDMQHVERLEPAAMATWFTVLSLRTASVTSTGAKLPDGLQAEGADTKQRMLKVLDYVLGEQREVSLQIADIRGGTGYVDEAQDLMRLAGLYETYALALAADQIRYRAEDAVNAKKIANKIVQVLGDGRASDTRYWTDYQARAWALLVNSYEEVAVAGQWLFRHENGEALFPSLYAVGRQPRRARRGDEGTLPGDAPAQP